MLPTFVIGLREGLEAALIVGIIAAFLRKQGRRDLLRWVFLGVGTAILLCVAAGVALNVVSQDLPQKQQEGLETIIGALAVGMVTYMVVWMKRNSRQLKGQLEGMAADAMGGTSGAARAMILMAFLAVLREGIETVVFLLAAFNQSSAGSAAPLGALLGILVAVGLGYGIYRGGVKINLSKFFRATGLVLVFVAAGIVVNALRTAHEAGWLDWGQGSTIDLSWLVSPGSVQASLLTGMLGVQSHPVVIEVIGWLCYLVPVGVYVAWPPGRSPARRTVSRVLLGVGAVLALGAGVLALVLPARPAIRPSTAGLGVVSAANGTAVVQVDGRTQRMNQSGTGTRSGVLTDIYSTERAGTGASRLPTRLSWSRVAELNGGHLPIGVQPTGTGAVVSYTDRVIETVWVDPRTERVVDQRSSERISATLEQGSTRRALAQPVAATTNGLPGPAVQLALREAARDGSTIEHRRLWSNLGWTVGVLGALLLLAGAGLAFGPRRRVPEPESAASPVSVLARH